MNEFYILLAIMFIGFGIIAGMMFSEKKKELPLPAEKIPSAFSGGGPKLFPTDILGRLGIEKPKSPAATSPSIQNKIAFSNIFSKKPQATDTTTSPIDLASVMSEPKTFAKSPDAVNAESELSLKYDELQAEHKELQDKYAKLDLMFQEKSSGLDRSEKTLTNEFKNQKEFNKVKDILEKELKDTKDKSRALQVDVTTAQTETQLQAKRVIQLEENVKKLEISLLSSEAAINDAQSETHLTRKKITELEGKMRVSENQILEKNQKIEDLVNRLKDLPNIFPGNSIGAEPVSPILSTDEIPPSAPPPEQNVVEKGGGEEDVYIPQDNPLDAQKTEREAGSIQMAAESPAPTDNSTLPISLSKLDEEPEPPIGKQLVNPPPVVYETEPKADEPESLLKAESLPLAPDIFAEKAEKEEPEPPPGSPPPEKT